MGGAIDWPTAEVRYGWHVAATLRDVHIGIPRGGQGQRTLQATIVQAHAFNLRQRPLRLVVPFGRGGWPILELTVENGVLRASLGPAES